MKKSVIEKMIADKSDGKLTGVDCLTCWIKDGIKVATSIGDIQDHINYSVRELLSAKAALRELDPDIAVMDDKQHDRIMAQFAEVSEDDLEIYMQLTNSESGHESA